MAKETRGKVSTMASFIVILKWFTVYRTLQLQKEVSTLRLHLKAAKKRLKVSSVMSH